MKYKSTRDQYDIKISFEDTLFKGLASDGGLFIPESIPAINLEKLEKIYMESPNSFSKIAFEISRLYIDKEEISDDDLERIMIKSFSHFRSSSVVPLIKLMQDQKSPPLYILELFHGPTFAFKDIALQVLGNLFEYFLNKKYMLQKELHNKKITLICATSGDTGGAAIYSVAGKSNIECYVLYPKDKISNIQKAQMTSVSDSNIHNIEIDGTFDDCQMIVKDLFRDTDFKNKINLSTFNSINWARIMIQITYYFCAYFQLKNSEKDINLYNLQFSVPTGNFGDILAGFYAKKMGLPIYKLIIATNENDILYRFMKDGVYQPIRMIETLSPAMDITISSNFERLLYYFAEDSILNEMNVTFFMKNLMKNGYFNVSKKILNEIRSIFTCEKVSNKEILYTIRDIYHKTNYLIDPHTAVGVRSFIKDEGYNTYVNNNSEKIITICLSTAHPGKFPEVINTILEEDYRNYFIPDILNNILSLEQKYQSMKMDKNILNTLKKYILDSQ